MSSVLSQYHLGRAGMLARDAKPTPAPASAPAPAPASGGISAGELSADVLMGVKDKIQSRKLEKTLDKLHQAAYAPPAASGE